MVINGELVMSGQYWLWHDYVVMRAGDGGPYRLSRLTDSNAGKVLTLALVGEWWTLHDAIQAARHDAMAPVSE